MTQTVLAVKPDEPIGTISPRLYGQFAEHLGRCCYDGLWCGPEAQLPSRGGFRADVLDALRALPVPLLRWPGGCYADHYHWRDGIGPSESRPRRLGMSCGLQVEDDNALGTHEFLWFCQQIGAEPYLAGNVGSGTPQELADWMEYCNSARNTTLTRERAGNGKAEPFGVRLWGVGNENWGCGGHFDPTGYAREYARFATMLRHVDPSAELVVCGHDDAWNEELFAGLGSRANLVDHLSIHRYWNRGGPETDFSEDEYYALLSDAAATEQFVERTAAILRDAVGTSRKIGIALDEWGVWHPEARRWPPRGNAMPRYPVTYEQAGTLRDALAAAIALEGFHRQCNVLSLANLAQVVNVLQSVVMTEGASMWRTPTYHALNLHEPHIGASALSTSVVAGASSPDGSSSVTATASSSNGRIAITVINRHIRDAADVCIDVRRSELECTSARLLTADSPRAVNSAETPDSVSPRDISVAPDGRCGWRLDLPPHSLATIVLSAN